MTENNEVRKKARAANIPYWKIADKLGVSENTLYRWLRKPLSESKKADVLNAITEIEREAVS